MIAIIGSGPAGISCALYLARANKDFIIFTNNKSSLCKATKIENYYGKDSISGEELYKEGLDELKKFNKNVTNEEVVSIDYDNSYKITTDKNEYIVDYVVLATGKVNKQISIPGMKQFIGKGISFCATCDGFFFKGKRIAILGSGNYALHEYNYLKNITDNLYLISNEEIMEEADYNKKIISIHGDEKINSITFEDNETLDIDALFIALEADTNALALKLGIQTNNNEIITNENKETNIPNIYAIGDCTTGIKQISKATYDGMMCALNIIEKEKKH